MPRLVHQLPKYRKHSSGQARVSINGRDYLLGPHGTKASKQEYDRLVAEYLASGRSASFGIEPQSLRLSMLMVAYLKHSRCYYGTGRTSEYHRITLALKPVRELYAKSPAADFGPTQLKAVREWMIGQDHSRTYINANIKRVVRMFRWGAEEEMVPESVHRTLRLVASLKRGKTKARETKPVKPVPLEVVEATIEELLPTFAAMVRIQLLTGCRPGEVCKLTPGMIDRSGDVWVAKLHEHKTAIHDHERYLYFGPKAQAVLRPFLLRGPDEYLFRPADTIKQRKKRDSANRTTPLSCGNRPGKSNRKTKGKATVPADRYTRQAYTRRISEAAKRAKVEHWSPNQLRHTRATEIRADFGLDAAASVLGHSQITTTQVYAEQDKARAIEVARKTG